MRRSASTALLVTVLILGLWKLVPFMSAPAPAIEATPTPPPLRTVAPVTVPGGSRMCTSQVIFTSDSRFIQLISLAPPDRRPALRVVAEAPGFRYATRVPAGPQGNVVIPIDPPPDERPGGKVCVTNKGSGPVAFAGLPPLASARAKVVYPTRSRTSVDGKASRNSVSLTLYRSLSASRFSNFTHAVANAATLRPLAPFLIWLVVLLLVVGAPLALAAAVGLSTGVTRRR